MNARGLSILLVLSGCMSVLSAQQAGCSLPSGTAPAHSLNQDAELAENAAIGYADSHAGPRSPNFSGMAAYARVRDQCMAELFQIVAGQHGVSSADVRQALLHRRVGVDLAIMLPFALLYIGGAVFIARRVRRQIPMLVFVSIATSAVGVLLGDQWCAAMEGIRLGTGTSAIAWSDFPGAATIPSCL